MVAESPEGPWKDPLGKALLTEGLVPTDPYDPGVNLGESAFSGHSMTPNQCHTTDDDVNDQSKGKATDICYAEFEQ